MVKSTGKNLIQLRMVVALLFIPLLLASGCVVSKSKHEAAVVDMKSAKVELEKSRMLRKALEGQNKTLKGQNEKVAMDLEMMASEVQRIKEGHESERAFMVSREKALGKKLQDYAKQLSLTKREFQRTKSQVRAFKDTIQRYQKELKEASERDASTNVDQTSPLSSLQPGMDHSPSTSPKPDLQLAPAPVAAPLKGSVALININTASANDLVLFLGLTKDMAEKVVANQPYRLKGELVAKKVVPKVVFDVIKDRISAVKKNP